MVEGLVERREGMGATLTKEGWIVGVRRYCRVLVLVVGSDVPLQRVEGELNRMTREYFSKAYI